MAGSGTTSGIQTHKSQGITVPALGGGVHIFPAEGPLLGLKIGPKFVA